MANKKPVVEILNDGSLFLGHTFDAKGKDTVTSINGERALDSKAVVNLLRTHVKGASSMRAMRQSMLAIVFSSTTLDGYKGKGDPVTGKTSSEFRDTVRKAEDAYLLSIRGDLTGQKMVDGKWIKNGVDNPEDVFAEVCREITNDNNYKNIKSWVSKYFAFCGAYPVTQSGYLVPQPIMAMTIQAALNVTPADNSIYAQLLAIKGTLDKSTLEEGDSRKCEPLARELASVFKALVAHYDELSTNKVQALPPNAGDTPAVASEALGKMRRALTPTTDMAHETT